MWSLQNFFRNQLRSHRCQLPTSDEIEQIKRATKSKDLVFISQNNLEAYMHMGTMSALWHEKLRQFRMTRSLVIHPYSDFVGFWHFYRFFFLLYCTVLFPFFSSFHGPFVARVMLFYDHSFTLFYCIGTALFIGQAGCFVDVVVNFIMGYSSSATNEVVIDPSGIARKYLFTFFLLDLLSSLPLDAILLLSLGTREYSHLPRWVSLCLSIPPLLKVVRMKALLNHFRVVFFYFCSSNHIHTMIVVIFFCPFLIHLSACCMFSVPLWIRYDRLLPPPVTKNCSFSWVVDEKLMPMSIFEKYFCSFCRSLMTFLHSGRSSRCLVSMEDKSLTLITALAGRIYKVVLLVVFLQMLSMTLTGRVLYLEMMDQVKQYISIKRFPEELERKIILNYVYLYQKEYTQEKQILKMLSESIRREILLWLHQSLIKKVYLFSGLSRNLILAIVNCLHPEIYLEDDVVYRAGEEGDCMYFISFGTVALYSRNNVETGHLDDGDHFGDICLILHLRRVETVVALEPTKLFRLTAQDFADLIKAHPTVYSKIEKMAMERYQDIFAKNEMGFRNKEDER